MTLKWKGICNLAAGFLLGTAGVKVLSSKDAKKAYTHITAGVLRMGDAVLKDWTTLSENCGDILADAKDINEDRSRKDEQEMIERARNFLSEAESRETDTQAEE